MAADEKTVRAEVADRHRLRTIAHQAYETGSPIMKNVLDQERAFRAKTEAELTSVLGELALYAKGKNRKEVRQQALKKLAIDAELTERLNAALVELSTGTGRLISYPLKTNKIAPAIKGAQTLLSEHFDVVVQGGTPLGYAYKSSADETTVLGWNEDTIHGNSKGTFFKTAALTLNIVCQEFTRLQSVYFGQKKSWVDTSSMAHVVPFPGEVWENLRGADPRFDDYSYFFTDKYTPKGLLYVHSGFAFGGHRDETRYMNGKAFGPHDCSSFMASVARSTVAFSTADQLCHYRLTFGGFTKEGWEKGPVSSALSSVCEPVVIRDPQRDIEAGQIYVMRRFNVGEDQNHTLGVSGHTALVLGFKSDGANSRVVTMGVNRDMPTVEGFGIQEFPLEAPNKQVLFFSTTGKSLGASEGLLRGMSGEVELKDEGSAFSTKISKPGEQK